VSLVSPLLLISLSFIFLHFGKFIHCGICIYFHDLFTKYIMSNDQSLLERIEMPSIPESAMKQIAILEEEFARAEVEQCMCFCVS
jgi:hypothetical protein